MIPYDKTLNLRKRDPATGYLTTEPRLPEFRLIDWWTATEKIDGTNCRLTVRSTDDTESVTLNGRTDRAVFTPAQQEWAKDFAAGITPKDANRIYTIYGELIGPKIQGNKYGLTDYRFIAFDVRETDADDTTKSWWVDDSSARAVADDHGLEWVGGERAGVIYDHEALTARGFQSYLAPVPAEGLVLKPSYELYTSRGERLKMKIKSCDYVPERTPWASALIRLRGLA